MTSRTRTAFIGGVLILAMLAMGAGFPAKSQVPPKEWAASVCGAVSGWVTNTQEGAKALTTDLQGSNPSVSEVRSALAAYLGDVAKDTTSTKQALKDAGVPATPKGKKAAAGLVTGFKKLEVALNRLHRQAQHISIKRKAAALAGLTKLKNRVNAEFNSVGTSFNALDRYDPGAQLSAAFKATQACQALSS